MYCSHCGTECKDTDIYCSTCGCLLDNTCSPVRVEKHNLFLAMMVVSNIMGILSAMIPIFYVYNGYNNKYINIGLWRYLFEFEDLFNPTEYKDFLKKMIEYGTASYAKDLICTVLGTTFLVMGIVLCFFSVIYALYFLYQFIQGIRGKRLANLSSRTMISSIAFFFCLLIYSLIPFSYSMNRGQKPNLSTVGFVILLVLLFNVIYIEKEYAKQDCTDDNEKVKKPWGFYTLIQMLVVILLIGLVTTGLLGVTVNQGKPYSSIYGWAIDGIWTSSENGSDCYDRLSVYINRDDVKVVIDGTVCFLEEDERLEELKTSKGRMGLITIFQYGEDELWLYITANEIWVENGSYHDTLERGQ